MNMKVLDVPLNDEPIEYLYAYIAFDGIQEGITALNGIPLVFSKEHLIPGTLVRVKEISSETKRKIKLVKFKKIEELEIIEP
jgi:hypothetical protein